MVISIAIPSATLNTNTVEGFNGTPTQPITPPVIMSGIIFGNKEHNNIFSDLNKYNMHKAINKKAQRILSFNPLIINLEPSKKVTLLPVNKISASFFDLVEANVNLILFRFKIQVLKISIGFINFIKY